MATTKTSIIIIYTTVALLILFLISHSPNNSNNNHHKSSTNHRHRRLKLRTTSDHHFAFDPIVADISRKHENAEWKKQHPHAKSLDDAPSLREAEDYLNDQDRFNVTKRLILLFPRIDIDPKDWFVSEGELTEWNLRQAEIEVVHRTQRELELHDKDRDGRVSFAEYEPPSWVRNSDNTSFGYDMGWWREEHFNASDADGDGQLNLLEFNDFLHPADTKNPKLLQWLTKEEIRERDTDRDGKVNFKEFFHGMFDLVRNYDEEGHNSSKHSDDSMEAPAKKQFAQLDKDGDGYLSEIELSPVMGKLHPSERYYAKQQSDYIISQVDTNKDGRLTLTEMIDNPYVFYSAIFSEDEEEDYHDEFR